MGILHGILLFFRALGFLLQNMKLIPFVLLPALTALLISIGTIVIISIYGDEFLAKVAPQYFAHYDSSWMTTTSVWVIKIAMNILSLFLIPWLVILVAFPLCEPLATSCDPLLGGQEVEISLFTGIGRSFLVSLGVVVLGLTGTVGLLFLGIVPIVGLMAPVIQMTIWTPLLLCFDLCDTVFARRQYHLKERWQLLNGSIFRTCSVGFFASFCVAIPFVNLVTLPIAVVMGTMYARELEQDAEQKLLSSSI